MTKFSRNLIVDRVLAEIDAGDKQGYVTHIAVKQHTPMSLSMWTVFMATDSQKYLERINSMPSSVLEYQQKEPFGKP